MNRIAVKWMAIPGLVTALACSDRHPAGPDTTALPDTSTVPAGVVISESETPLTGASSSVGTPGTVNVSSDAAVAYVSIKPGTYPQAIEADLRNRTANGAARHIRMSDGGFDPVSIAAQPADSLLLKITMADWTTISLTMAVPKRRPPTVVRSDPPKGRTDVAMNVVVSVIFSEPVDPKTVIASDVTLRGGGQVVSGVLRVSNDGLTVELVPDKPLDPSTSYELAVATEIRDLDGDALDESYDAAFLTAAPPVPVVRPSELSLMRMVFAKTVQDSAGIVVGSHLFSINADGTDLQELTSGAAQDGNPAVSPDGQRIAFVRDDNIYVMNIDGSEARRLTATRGYSPSWSPDGTMLAFGDSVIWIIKADGTGLRQLTHPAINEGDTDPSWSPDGDQIAFERFEDLDFEVVWVINVDGSGETELGRKEGYRTWASWSPVWIPDGSGISFSGPNDDMTATVFSMRADGSNPFAIGSAPRPAVMIEVGDWSDDSQWIGLDVVASNGTDIYVMNRRGIMYQVTADGKSSGPSFVHGGATTRGLRASH
jgi:Bacterial Ig-like domain/Dipeptidyl peptidase IV (DPP IV) N-terminal region/WD40-like Beta Propeller Repeat